MFTLLWMVDFYGKLVDFPIQIVPWMRHGYEIDWLGVAVPYPVRVAPPGLPPRVHPATQLASSKDVCSTKRIQPKNPTKSISHK